ncbi:UNVERIFIED_CONTAM: Transposon Tf2-11 polyprotein [Sesamum calycinum]|uniref:Transposon Tf2-11 polyprotein n=1 Tax=Sesamum calycinum TaxID=2727403 RepID=A0AAW2QME3_9LAMI
MPSSLRQLEESDGDRSCVGLTRYVETVHGGDRCFRLCLRRVLMQDGHPVAFESRKLKDVERRYSVHEKELLAVVHCLRLWRHYLLGSPFVVKTDNIAVSHFMSQPKLTSRQARWQELLSEFHFVLEYRAGSSNHVADALSRRADLATLGSVAALSSSASCHLRKGSGARVIIGRSSSAGPGPPRRAGQSSAVLVRRGTTDDQGKPLICAERRGPEEITHCGMPRHSLGGTSGRRAHLCVGAAGLLLATDAGRCRDVCPHLFDLSAGQGRPSEESRFATTIAHPKETWESVSMDYISGLPKVGDLGTIIVVVDRLSKYATFIAAPKHVTAEGTAHLFFKHVVKYWGLPKDIVSDRDSRFTGVSGPSYSDSSDPHFP